MKRILVITAGAALLLAGPAQAKGPTSATITGPGLDEPIRFAGDAEGNPSSTFGQFVMESGFIPAVFAQTPDPMLAKAPTSDLGPKYRVVYGVPGPDDDFFTLRQDLYPYADGGAVTYLRPGQRIFEGMKTRGGWFQAGEQLKETLVAAGLPRSPRAGGGDGAGFSVDTRVLAVAAFALGLAIAAALVLRRRPHLAS